MDTQTCKHCSTLLYNGGNRCPSCGKLQSYKTLWITLSLTATFLLLCSLFLANKSQTTETAAPTVSPTAQTISPTTTQIPIIPTPQAKDGWTKIQPGVYARSNDSYNNNCFLMGTGVEYCAGQTVEYYTTNGRLVVAWENSWSQTRCEITPGEPRYVSIPDDAYNIHWEWR